MSSNKKRCHLIPAITTMRRIFLPDGEEVTIGRNLQSGITDLTCSRKQVAVKADYCKAEISIKLIGQTPSYYNGNPMVPNETYHLKDGSIFQMLHEKLSYKVAFQAPKQTTDQVHESSSESSSLSPSQSPKPKKVMTCCWKTCSSGALLMCISSGFDENKIKVASFDLDGTLIKTKSGRVFGINFDDWMLWDESVKTILSKLVKDDYKIIIFTNQAGLGTVPDQIKLNGFKRKIEKIIIALNVPVQVFVATSIGIYRKPSPGMWIFMKMRMDNVTIDLEKSFYVGDAAGRPLNWKEGKKEDFAVSDRLFATNIGIQFYTPEEYFLKEPVVNYTEIKFHPSQYDKTVKLPECGLPPASQEVIIMVGSPGSGKSHFIKHYILPHGYYLISRDKVGTWQKCVSFLHGVLKSQKSAVIDNTNPDRASRQRYIEVCRKYNVKVRCFFMDSTLERCLHNNKFREIIDSEHEIISATLIKKFHSNVERPTIEEGFLSIVNIPFVPHYENDEQEYFYNCYLVSK